MKFMSQTIIIILIIAILCDCSSRVKRQIVFRKNSKFFLRLNGKEPIFNYTTIFQHGWGFRMNWEMPDSISKLHQLYKRDVGEDMKEYFERPQLLPYICLLKHLASKLNTIQFSDYCGILCDISEIVKSHTGDDVIFFKNILTNLQNFKGNCPDIKYETALNIDL